MPKDSYPMAGAWFQAACHRCYRYFTVYVQSGDPTPMLCNVCVERYKLGG